MEKSLFTELKAIGIDEEVAAHVQASLNGEHYATKNDMLAMQQLLFEQHEKMMNGFTNLKSELSEVRTELKTELAEVRTELKMEIAGVRTEVKSEIADVRAEIGGMHRQYWITFGGLITTIISVFAVNWYYHM